MSKEPGRRRRRVPCGFAAASAAVILVLTLWPVDAIGGTEPWSATLRFRGFRGLADSIANVLLFLPFGLAMAACLVGRARPVLAGLALSMAIELAQLVVPGRYTSPWDVLFNTTGAAAGVALFRSAPVWLWPTGALRAVLPLAAFAGALTILIGGAALLAPQTLPGPLIGQWTHVYAGAPSYDGRIIEAHVGGIPVGPRSLPDSDAIRAALFRDTTRLLVEAGPPPHGAAPLFAVAAPRYRTLLSVVVDGADVIVRYRMRALAVGLDQPDIRLVDALAGISPGETFSFSMWWQDSGPCVAIDQDIRCDLGFSVADTWALLLYPVKPKLQRVLPWLWTAALLLPAGFWIRRTRVALLAAAMAAITLAAAPVIVASLTSSFGALAAAVVGVLAGHTIRRSADRRHRTQERHTHG